MTIQELIARAKDTQEHKDELIEKAEKLKADGKMLGKFGKGGVHNDK